MKLSRIFGRSERKATDDASALTADGLLGRLFGVVERTKGLPHISTEKAMRLSASLCAARVIAETVAQIPFNARSGSDRWSPIATGSDEDRLLNWRPNAFQTAFEFREFMTLVAVFGQDACALVTRDNAGRPLELLPLIPRNVTIELRGDWTAAYTVRLSSGQVLGPFDRSDILHVRGPSLDRIHALGIIDVIAEPLGLAVAMDRSAAKLHVNGGRPPGILTKAGAITAPEIDRIREDWRSKYGPNGEGGVALLDGAWSYAAMAMTSTDAQHLEMRRFIIEEVARAFRVFPQMMMHADKVTTYASAEQFFIANRIYSVGPWLERWAQAADVSVLHGSDLSASFDDEILTLGSGIDRANYFAKALGAGNAPGWMTQNDVRQKCGLPPLAGGDRLFEPAAGAPAPGAAPAPEDPS